MSQDPNLALLDGVLIEPLGSGLWLVSNQTTRGGEGYRTVVSADVLECLGLNAPYLSDYLASPFLN